MRKESYQESGVKSLAGRIDKLAMGSSVFRDKPKKTPVQQRSTDSTYKPNSFKEGNILEEKFDETVVYRPQTKENKLIYENFLGKMYELVQDQPPETLISISDEVLAIIKSDLNEAQKKTDCETLLSIKITENHFIDICNIVKSLTDYHIEEQQWNDNIVNIPEEDENEHEKILEEIEEEEGDDNNEHHLSQEHPSHSKTEHKHESKLEEHDNELDVSSIHAYWLQEQLLKYYQPNEVLHLEKDIIVLLKHKSKLEVENGLLALLNYDRYDLIKVLLKNRMAIYYGILYHQSQNDKEKEQLLEEMRQNNIQFSRKSKKLTDILMHSERTEENHKNIESFIEDETNHLHTRISRDDELSRLNKKIIDLSLHDNEDRTNAKLEFKFKLPEGATKVEMAGYEEIHIPPKKKRVEEKLIEVDTLPPWMQSVFTGVKRFNPIQSRVLPEALFSNRNLLVCAPTSSGKTNIALLTILEAIKHYTDETGHIDTSKFKIVYIAPMKALVAEITGNISNRLSPLGVTVKELTGDMHLSRGQIDNTQVIISTPEKWDIITRKAGDRLFIEKVKLLIIDEIHMLSDSRGPVLESIIARTIRQVEVMQQQTRLVGLSATLPNYKDVGAVLRVRKESLFYFDDSYRPIPLEQRYLGVTEKKGVRKMLMVNEILYEKVMERVTTQQMIIFVHSRRDTVRTANAILETAMSKNELARILRPDSESKKILEAIAEKETINNKDLKELLIRGIGIHHAGLSRADRDLAEQLFADRHFNILVSTATLAWGVNLPAHTVIIKGTQVYSAEDGRWIELSLQDVMQMLGRAGRPRYDEEGEGIIITGYDEVRYYLSLLNMTLPLESQMLKSLADQLNAEVVLGAVSNLRDGVNWLAYTYLFVRMLKNPRYYSIPPEELEEDKQLLQRRVNLIHSAFTLLERNGLLNYDRKNGQVSATFLGRTASYYYIKYPSMTIYNSNLKLSTGIIELFKIFAMSLEFKYLTVREEEKNELRKLVETVPVPIKGSPEDATTKISALLQAHISRLQLEGFALNIDKVYVTQSASRIMRALFEICLKRGWGQATQRTLELAKMIDRAMWSCLNPLRQFKEIPEYVLSRLEKKEQFSWESFYQMTPQEIGDLTKFPKLGKILHKFVHHIPRVQLDTSAQPLTRSCLRVDLKVSQDFRWEEQYHGHEEPFWLLVLDCNEETILYSYHFTLQPNTPFITQFIVPLYEVMHPLYFIKVISDRWICSDNVLPLSFKTMVLPSKFSPSHELFDLQQLPATSIDPIAKDLRISYLNQIQTQTYSAFVNSNDNLFLGASEGSGKFTLAIFAMEQVLNINRKVIIIVSNPSIALKKHLSLSKLYERKKKVGRTCEELSKDSIILQNMDIIIATPEAWDVLIRRWKARKGFMDIGLVVIDNLHLLEIGNSTLEVVVSRTRSIASQMETKPFRIIGLSTSLADYVEVAEWIGASHENTFNFHSSVRANSIEVIFHSYDQPIRESRLYNMQKQLTQTILHYNRSTLTIICDKKQARLTALDMVSELSIEANPKRLRNLNDEQMRHVRKRISDHYLLHLLDYGIAYIHEGMNESERIVIEQLFATESILVLLVTENIKRELDYKVFLVAVLDCSHYDTHEQRWIDYNIPEMLQIMSLSSTSEKDKHKGKEFSSSKFIIFCESAKKQFYKKFLFEPYPLESSLHLHMADHICAGVVAKSIQNKEDCIDWLTWSFMYRRLNGNPNFYNMEETSEEGISSYLSELVENTVDYLEKIKCVEVENEMELTATNLGIICSYYYVKVETIGKFVANITEAMKLTDIIELISQSTELTDCSYRLKEYELIAQLLVAVNEKPINKPHGLLLLHFYRIPIPQELLADERTILPLCVRLSHALVDVLSSFGYFKPLILCMQFCQMLVQGMWVNDLPLMQVVDKETATLLQTNYNIKDLDDFFNMDDEQREKALIGKDIKLIATACNRCPVLTMTYQVIEQGEEEAEIQVTLERDDELENELVMSAYYPGEKEEFWWLVIGDKKTNKVLTTKRTLIKKTVNLNLSFELKDVAKPVLYALCDSYIGRDQAEELVLGG